MVKILRILIHFFAWAFRPFKHKRLPTGPIECLVVGYGGANNTGAEARTGEAIEQMLAADDRIVVTLTSLDKKQTLRYLKGNERLKVAQIDPVFIFSILKLVLRSDIVVLVEGSCFKENFSAALFWFFMYAAELAIRFNIPVVTYGVDAGTLTPEHKKWAKFVADRTDLLMVRTDAAARILKSIGVKREIVVTTDTAFSLVPESKEWAEVALVSQGIDLKKPIIGIAFEEFFWWPVVPRILKGLFGVKNDRYKSIYYHSWGADGRATSCQMKNEVARYADWAAGELGAQVVFFAMEKLDTLPCKDVMALMKSKSVLFDSDHANAKQITALLRRLNLLITCRYHALVLAMGGYVPTIGLAHDERIAAIMDELGFIEDYFISYEEKHIFDLLVQKTVLLEKRSSSVKNTIEKKLPSYLARMAENQKRFSAIVSEKFPK